LWKVISWDFIIKLPKLKDLVIKQLYNAILVIINRLTKWGYFIACTEEISAKNVAQIYVKKVFARHKSLKKNHIGQRPKVHDSILGNLFGRTKSLCSNINSISSANRWSNKKTEPDIGTVFTTLCQLHTE